MKKEKNEWKKDDMKWIAEAYDLRIKTILLETREREKKIRAFIKTHFSNPLVNLP